ncbi:hypothetical protein DFH06DRAFT_1216249 [Mycena polygramma]|nr:hypothetical protein DFH06DRAFT_1216249 [Mycena polygramma]
MQLDVVLEVLGHLHPIDLIHVSCTSKEFHELLRSPVTDSTWRNSFLVEYKLPQCPPQLSGRRWAKLLFGPRECGRPDTDSDYILSRLACVRCLEENLLDVMPGYTDSRELNSVVHRTPSGGMGECSGAAMALPLLRCTPSIFTKADLRPLAGSSNRRWCRFRKIAW